MDSEFQRELALLQQDGLKTNPMRLAYEEKVRGLQALKEELAHRLHTQRRELGRALQLRYTPELQFIADDSIQHGAHILEILRQVERQDEARDDPDAGETEE